MKELFRLTARVNPLSLRGTDTNAAIITTDKAGKDTRPEDGDVLVIIGERDNGKGEEEIIFILKHPKARGEIIVTPYRAKKMRQGSGEFPIKKEEFLEFWPDGIANLIFILSRVERFFEARRSGYKPSTERWIMTLLG